MLVAIAPLFIAAPIDYYYHFTLNSTPLVSLYSMVFFIFIESQIIGHKFSRALKISGKLSNNLKQEVDLRTLELNNQNKKMEKTQEELLSANTRLKKLSITDGLTQIYNRMYFEKQFRKEWRRCSRQGAQISVLMIDVDNFKSLNDSAGHLAGDKVLQSIASALHNYFKRAGDLVARYGGEEFIVMLPETDQRQSIAMAEGLRLTIEKLVTHYNDHQFSVTVSIGISTTTPSANLSPEHLLRAADSALYKAKNTGRNRIEMLPLLPARPTIKSSPQQRPQ
jgi:diguanylate cyclase (GGDEF)-like protein